MLKSIQSPSFVTYSYIYKYFENVSNLIKNYLSSVNINKIHNESKNVSTI